MKFLTVTELRLKATEVIREIEQTGDDVVITKKGKPVVLMQHITDEVFSIKKKQKEEQQLSFL
jgi:prevent-host-death family protein